VCALRICWKSSPCRSVLIGKKALELEGKPQGEIKYSAEAVQYDIGLVSAVEVKELA
jgi:hypothetical protein